MDFITFKKKVDRYLSDLYSSYRDDVGRMNQLSNVKKQMSYEQQKINNYACAVINELKYEVEEGLLQSYSLDKIEVLLEGRFKTVKFKAVLLQEEQLMKREVKHIPQQVHTQEETTQGLPMGMICMGVACGAVAGGLVGGLVAEKVLLGAGIGATIGGIGGAVYGSQSTAKPIATQKQTQTSIVEKQSLDKEEVKRIITKREDEVRRRLFSYIDEIEAYYNELRRG